MDKEKQIEEMYNLFLNYKYNKIDWKKFDCIDKDLFEFFYNAGYIKIPENAVVLTEEELKEKIDCCDVSMIHHDDDGKRYIEYEKYEDFTDRLGKRIQQLKGQLKQARKETAEKFAEKFKEKMAEVWGGLGKIPTIEFAIIDEIAKEFTEGKK